MPRSHTRFFLGIALLSLVLWACDNQSAASKGEPLYDQYCSLCHGPAGEGYAADNANALANQNFLKVASDKFLTDSIVYGRPGTPMSAWAKSQGGPLSDLEIENLVAYIRSWQKEDGVDTSEQVSGTYTQAVPVYMERCASCHGDMAQGKTALSLSNPRFLASASDGFLKYAIEHGRPGTAMPAFTEQLDEAAIDDLVALLRSYQKPPEERPLPQQVPSYDKIIINPQGEHPDDFVLREDRFLPADSLKTALEQGRRLVILDARPSSDYLMGHIPGSLSLPFYEATEVFDLLPRDGTWIVAYCGCPHAASGRVVDELRKRGFPKTAVMDEGIFVWDERGYPMDKPDS